jgi:sugar (pentulose or hexulose) kinase
MDAAHAVVAQAAVGFGQSDSTVRDPRRWWSAISEALIDLLKQIRPESVRAIAVDGTSGTVLPVDANGAPLAEPLMYNDAVDDKSLPARIGKLAPAESAAHGASSGLAKALTFAALPGVHKILHQADWVSGQFSGRFDLTDDNNALKTGYDPVSRTWPAWIAGTSLPMSLLPDVKEPGEPLGRITSAAARKFGLPDNVLIVAGTTDGCASFLATGATDPGDGVTALGSSLTLKLLSQAPIFAPQYGIYSHRIGNAWLAGGASNTGGRVLAQFFTSQQLKDLSAGIDPDNPTGLDYYPLPGKGERFPIADPDMPARLEPRPADDAVFLQALLEGIAGIERLGYARLAELGAPKLATVRTVGGGAANPAWTAIRRNALGVPFLDAISTEAAAGTARLALKGAIASGAME